MKDIKIVETKVLQNGVIELSVKDSKTGDIIKTRTPIGTMNSPFKEQIIDDVYLEIAQTLLKWR